MVHAKKLVESGIRNFAHLQIGHAWPREFGVRQFVSLLRKAFCCAKPLDRPRGNLMIALSTCKNITRAVAHKIDPRMKKPRRHKPQDKKGQKLNLRNSSLIGAKLRDGNFHIDTLKNKVFMSIDVVNSRIFQVETVLRLRPGQTPR
jgi:hypothetical protein